MTRIQYRFGDCTVDPAARELRRAGELVVLSPKVFDCIAYLIEHRDRAVGRDELIAAVWGRTDVTDALLGQAVLKARRVIGDTGDEQNAIRTIPRFGYRWVAELGVEERLDAPPTTDDERAPTRDTTDDIDALDRADPATHSKVSSRSLVLVALAAAALLAGVLVVRHYVVPRATPTATAVETSDVIAVLPVTVDADAQWSWLRLGLMDLIAQRMRHAGLAVVPSDNIVAVTRESTPDMAQHIRTATGARRVLEAHAIHNESGWRVRLALQAASGSIDVEANAADPVAATRAGVVLLLQRLGKRATDDDAQAPLSLDQTRQQVEAAILVDDLDAAQRIIESAPPEVRDAPELRLRLALIDLRTGRTVDARQRLDRLLVDVAAETDPLLRARVLTTLSSVEVHAGDFVGAARACSDAIALLAGRNEPAVAGRVYTACGVANASAGRFDAAMSDFAQARVAFEITGDALSLARIEANEGFMEITRGRYAEGIAIMRRSEDQFSRLGGRLETLAAINDQVDAYVSLLRPVDALATSERGWAMLPQVANTEARHAMQVQHARALAANGRVGEAAALLTMIDSEANPAQELAVLGRARSSAAAIELASGRAQAAVEHARAAVAALVNPDDTRERALAWRLLVRALRVAANETDAAEQLRAFAAWAAPSRIDSVATYAALAAAELHWRDQRAAATADYEHALAAAEATGIPLDVGAVSLSWGDALLENGELERASGVIGRASRWAAADFACSVMQARLYRALGRADAWRDALQRARTLAGERPVPASASAPLSPLSEPPAPAR